MSDKPDLFQRIFRKTQEKLEKKVTSKPIPHSHSNSNSRIEESKSNSKIKIPLTGSKLDTYQVCPKRFHYQYIQKISCQSTRSIYLSFDNSLHSTLKAFYKSYSQKEGFKLEKLLHLLVQNWDKRGYETEEEEREYKIQAENALRWYFQNFCETPSRAIEIDYSFKVDLMGCEYSGKIDRIDKNPDGTLEIIDYKSGKIPPAGVRELENSLSVQLLFLVADVIWPQKVKKITHIYLKEATTLSVYRNPVNIAEAKKKYLEIGEKIYQGQFQPIRSQACEFCDYHDICPVGQILFLSPAKIKTFLECPQKYAATYVHRTTKKSDAEFSFELVFDRALHDALHTFYKNFKLPVHGDPMSFMLSCFFQALPSNIPDELVELVKIQGREAISQFFISEFSKTKVVHVNEPISLITEAFEFQASIDRVDEDSDGKYILIDYKSGKKVSEAEDIKLDNIAAAICFAANSKWPGKVKALKYVFLRSGEAQTVDVDQFILERGRNILYEITKKIKEKQFETTPGFACQKCTEKNFCQAGILSVSAAKLQTLRDCPKKYKFQYIDKAEVSAGDKPYLLLSQIVHDTLKFLFSQNKLISFDELSVFFNKKLAEVSPELQKQVQETGINCLKTFYQGLNGKLPKIKTLAEKAKAIIDGILVNAIFDRVDYLPNGKLEIIDYKTSRRAMTMNEKERDVSAVLTFLVADRIWPQKIEKVTFHYLIPGQKLYFTPTDSDIQRAKLALSEFSEEIAKGTFEGHRNPLCPYCEYMNQCEDAKRLLLSPSKINSFQSCPLKYKLSYIDRIPKESRPTPHLNFDRSIHYALKEFHEQFSEKSLRKNPFPYLLGKYWISDGYSDWEEEQKFRARALEYLEKYFNSLTGKEKIFMLETSATWKLNSLDLTVQIDRIDELPNGKLEVIDYKTGRKIPNERLIHEDIGLMNLFLAANHRWPGKIEAASYHFLATNKRIRLAPTEEQIQKHKEKILQIVSEIERDHFPPVKGALCNFCEFYGPCPEWKVKPFMVANETMDAFRKRIRLSYSKMSLYENCPRAYKKLYIDRIPPKPQPFFSFGTCIHETFEEIYDPEKPPHKPTWNEIMQIYNRVWQKHREGYKDEATEEKYKEDGKRQLLMYYKRFIENQEFTPAYAIEEYFEIPIGKYAVMTGFIDRIDRLPDGTYEILDYKTEPTDRTQEEVDNDKQLSIYYWACETALGLKISKLSLFMLDHDKKITTTRCSEDVKKVVEHVDEVAYNMIHEQEFKPKKNKYCKSCDHLDDCPLKEEILADNTLISMKKF